MSQCENKHPKTGEICTMGEGHAGPHKAGGPYHTFNEWVTPCTDRRCIFHHNSHGRRIIDGETMTYDCEECIHCGDLRPKMSQAVEHYISLLRKRSDLQLLVDNAEIRMLHLDGEVQKAWDNLGRDEEKEAARAETEMMNERENVGIHNYREEI